MSKYEKKLLKLINENFAPEEEAPDVSGEQKKSFVEAVGNFHSFGESIYRNHSLREITSRMKEIVKTAEQLTLKESEHWFDNVTVSRHMKQLSEAHKVFEKAAGEVTSLQQRLESAYEDMGSILNKYYKVNEALAENISPEEEEQVDEELIITAKALKKLSPNLLKKLSKKMDIDIEEDINITAKALKKLNPNFLKKLSKKMDIEIGEGVDEKVVFYKDKENRLRRFDTDNSANKKYQ